MSDEFLDLHVELVNESNRILNVDQLISGIPQLDPPLQADFLHFTTEYSIKGSPTAFSTSPWDSFIISEQVDNIVNGAVFPKEDKF